MSTSSEAFPSAVSGVAGKKDPSQMFLGIGIAALVVALGWMLFVPNAADPSRAFAGYLLGVSYWISILVGMLFLTMIFWLFDAGWAVIVRRQLEHAMAGFVWMGVLFLPLVLMVVFAADSPKISWIWMSPGNLAPSEHGTVGEDILWQKKAGYLNTGFFVLRYVLIFAVWSGLAFFFRRWSFRMDETGDHKYVDYSRRLAAGGVLLCAIFTSIAAIDWFKSLNYHWFSTMFGVWFFAASMRAALSASVLILFWQGQRRDGLAGALKPVHTYLIACIMLAFTVFWAYISFSQFFLINNANIPEETFWYNIREEGGWFYVSRMLIFLHFFFPFLYLLFFNNKFEFRLKFIAIWILVFHFFDMVWNILPQQLGDPTHQAEFGTIVRPVNSGLPVSDFAALIGAGAIFIWAFLRSVHRHRSIPIRDPRIQESLHYHG